MSLHGTMQSGERTTLHKVTVDEPLCVAHPFSVGGAPGLACFSTKGHLQVNFRPCS